jgi:hypothetical protein
VLAVPGSHGFDVLAWLLPFAGIIAGTGAVAVGARAWSKNRDEAGRVVPLSDGPSLGAALELRVDQELASFDN